MKSVTLPTKVNGGAVRIAALFSVVIAVVSGITGTAWLAALLAVDFGIRGILTPRYSPTAAGARLLQPHTPFKGTPIFYAPKRFAARIGLLLSAGGAIFLALGLSTLGSVILYVLGFFAFLEGAFGYCVGCKIYGLLIRSGLIPRENCPDCV